MNGKNKKQDLLDVLIVGAGPAGLIAACQLINHGLKIKIIDKRDRQTPYSGALLVQARTLEIFDQIGLANEAIKRGIIAKNISLFRKGKKMLQLNIEKMGDGISKFPFILMLKQKDTEDLLIEYLKNNSIEIERNLRFLSLKKKDNHISALIENSEGKQENIKSTYLIGADGSESNVRNCLGLRRDGSMGNSPLCVSDCSILHNSEKSNQTFENNDIIFSISENSIAGFFALNDSNWRVDSIIPDNLLNKEKVSFDEVVKDFSKRVYIKVQLTEPKWFSVFRPGTYLSNSFSSGNCFLVGDAAHVHTPIGAQGMNTGIQDSYNLAWKIAFALKHKMSAKLLESYSRERYHVAKKLIRTTDKYFEFAISKKPFKRLLRLHIFPRILKWSSSMLKQKYLQNTFFRNISETNIRYGINQPFSKKSSLKGRQVPYEFYKDMDNNTCNMQEKLSVTCFTLFVFYNGKNDNWKKELSTIKSEYQPYLNIEMVPLSGLSTHFFKKIKVKNTGYLLTRPDGYIAMHSKKPSFKNLNEFFEELIN